MVFHFVSSLEPRIKLEKVYLTARDKNRSGVFAIKVEYSNGIEKVRINTGVKVHEKYWDTQSRLIKANGAANVGETNAMLKKVVANLAEQVQTLFIANGNIWPSKAQLEAFQATKATEVAQAAICLTTELETFVANNPAWKPATVKNFTTLKNNIFAYQNYKKCKWYATTLTTDEIRAFQHWCLATYGYNNATLGKRVQKLRQLLQHLETPMIKGKIKPLFDQKLYDPIVLHQSEIEAIRRLDLSGNKRLERVRDLQMLMIFTGLRYSDMCQLQSEHIKLKTGQISIEQVKTEQEVSIPIFGPVAAVLGKYTDENGVLNLPTISGQKLNDYIREVCQLVPELQYMVKVKSKVKSEIITEKFPKWELITCHTSRRSFVSLCLDLGYTTKKVMSWSGHKTLSAFQRYVGRSEAQANEVEDFTARYNASLAN